jgi:hypothetical protein
MAAGTGGKSFFFFSVVSVALLFWAEGAVSLTGPFCVLAVFEQAVKLENTKLNMTNKTIIVNKIVNKFFIKTSKSFNQYLAGASQSKLTAPI